VDLNLAQGRDDIAIFEVGKGYGYDEAAGVVHEWWRLGLALTGASRPAAWNRAAQPWEVDDAKGIVELLATRLGFDAPAWSALTDSRAFHPGRSAIGSSTGALRASIGELHPALRNSLGLRAERVIIGTVAVRGLAGGSAPAVKARPIPRFPAVERDLAVVVTRARTAGEVERSIRAAGGALLGGVRLFDIYRGQPLSADEQSLAYRLTFQAEDRTLTDPEIDSALATVTAALAADVGGRIRT
jgi:phenylalanyl-tRNA synthetase beta chain